MGTTPNRVSVPADREAAVARALVVQTGLIAELQRHLDDGGLDLVLGPIHDDLPARFQPHRLVPETLVLITPPGRHPVGRLNHLGVCRDEQFVCLPPDSGLHAIVVRAAAEQAFPPG